MTDDTGQRKALIVETLKTKSVLKQKVFDNTGTAFMMIKEILKQPGEGGERQPWRSRPQGTHGIY